MVSQVIPYDTPHNLKPRSLIRRKPMHEHQGQSELSEQLRTWAAAEIYEDSRRRLERLAKEYEKLAEQAKRIDRAAA
jgi:hypothetical protein